MVEEYLSLSSSIINLLSGIIILLGGIMGIKAINKLKDKKFNAVFNFYSRLKVQLKILENLYSNQNYKIFILDRLVIESARRNEITSLAISDKIIEEIAEVASLILKYLMDENNQMPASKKWIEEINTLVEFLEDCKLMGNFDYYKWNEDNDNTKENYYKTHLNNLKNIIKDIENEQIKIINKIFKQKKSLFVRIKQFLKQ